jgi:hypothetical protein
LSRARLRQALQQEFASQGSSAMVRSFLLSLISPDFQAQRG